MTNPSVLLRMAKEREREALEASRGPGRAAAGPRMRERLGWSLIGLGAHLAGHPGGRRAEGLGVARNG